MKIVWTININDDSYFPPNHNIKPVIWNDKLIYAYETIGKIDIDKSGLYGPKLIVLEIDLHSREIIKKEHSLSQNKAKGKLARPKSWKFILDKNQLQLNTGMTFIISESEIRLADKSTELENFEIKSQYQLNGKSLNYNQRSKLECFDLKTQKLIWKQKLKGYIYSDIEQKENLIFFGTAGKGGAFYCVNLNNGEILTEYNNGDASDFSWHDGNIIIRDKRGNLVKINSQSGEMIDELKLKDKISYYAPILIESNKIYVRTFAKKDNIPKLICVEI